MEKDGRLLFTDLDSTNGSTVNGDEVEPHEPYELSVSKPVTLAVGSSQLELTFNTHP
jgi:pSer/pThr/pTyr-binding forkhead associated (FHA) protein